MFNGRNSTELPAIELAHILVPKHTVWMSAVRVAPSSLAGLGCFAVENIPQGYLAAVAGGRVVTELPAEDLKFHYAVNFGNGIYIAPADYQSAGPEWFLNHHCESNLRILSGTHFYAAREIKAGEELLIDYGVQLAGRMGAKFHCTCGSSRCRGEIRGDDYLSSFGAERFQEVSPPIQKEILSRE